MLGRRASHVAGRASDLPGEQVRIALRSGLSAFLSGTIPDDMPGLMAELSDLMDSRPRHG